MGETANSPAHVLPDLLEPGLRIVFCGTAAGAVSAAGAFTYSLFTRSDICAPFETQ